MGGGGGGAARGASTDFRVSDRRVSGRLSGGGWLGTGGGGGTALGAAAEGIGGGRDGGASFGDATEIVSSMLDSRPWAFRASLCGTEEAMSVS